MSGAPKLCRRLVLEAPQQIPDGSGGLMDSWAPLGILWAEVKAGTGREIEENFLTLSYVPYRITVRAAPHASPRRPRPDQRFREGTRIFRILAVADADPGCRYLICHAREEEVSG